MQLIRWQFTVNKMCFCYDLIHNIAITVHVKSNPG